MPKSNAKLLAALILIAALVLITSVTVFIVDSSRETTKIFGDDLSTDDLIYVKAEIISVDPINSKLTLRLEILPHGIYKAEDNYMSRWTYMFVNNLEGDAEYNLDPDRPLTSELITLDLIEGDVIMYPFDQHKSIFVLEISTSEEEQELGAPLMLEFKSDILGYQIDVIDEYDLEMGIGYLDFGIVISRTLPVKFFVGLVILMQWLLAMSALLITASALTRKSSVDIRISSWFAAMLFALPALRRSVPEAPPLGVLYDYLSFFWVEGIVAICLAIYVLLWYFRHEK